MDVAAFVSEQLPAAPARVLEIGCGDGRLARAVARLGYDVVAIDPRAPAGEIFEAVSLEDFAGPGGFDAAVASRVLHHIPRLGDALDKVARLLRPGGLLVVREHAWEQMDESTARWYLERRADADSDPPPSVEDCLSDWVSDHAGLHGYAEMRAELDRRFRERFFTWTPYLYEELGGGEVEREESALIKTGVIRATGFCYSGRLLERAR
jgi:SAM-dependent methyltransferase